MGVVSCKFLLALFTGRLNETEGVLLSNKAPPTDDVISAEDLQDGDIDSLHPYVKTGIHVHV